MKVLNEISGGFNFVVCIHAHMGFKMIGHIVHSSPSLRLLKNLNMPPYPLTSVFFPWGGTQHNTTQQHNHNKYNAQHPTTPHNTHNTSTNTTTKQQQNTTRHNTSKYHAQHNTQQNLIYPFLCGGIG